MKILQIINLLFFNCLNSECPFDYFRAIFQSDRREYLVNNEETSGRAPFCKLCNFSMTFSSSHLQKHNNTEKHLRNCRIAVCDEGLSYQGQIYQDTDVDDRKVCSLLLTTGNDTLVFTNVKV